jgi:hypothetical protein
VELAFETKEVREICEVQLTAEAQLGIPTARSLRARLADLRAAHFATEILAGSPHVLTDVPPGLVHLLLDDGYLLAYCANHVVNPTKDTGELDWASVGRVKILSVHRNDG